LGRRGALNGSYASGITARAVHYVVDHLRVTEFKNGEHQNEKHGQHHGRLYGGGSTALAAIRTTEHGLSVLSLGSHGLVHCQSKRESPVRGA
jgi:hypothetical protein